VGSGWPCGFRGMAPIQRGLTLLVPIYAYDTVFQLAIASTTWIAVAEKPGLRAYHLSQRAPCAECHDTRHNRQLPAHTHTLSLSLSLSPTRGSLPRHVHVCASPPVRIAGACLGTCGNFMYYVALRPVLHACGAWGQTLTGDDRRLAMLVLVYASRTVC